MKWTLIRGRRPAGAVIVAIPTVIAFVVVVTVIVTVGVVLTSTGCILAAMRRESRRKKTVSDWYVLPEGYIAMKAGAEPNQVKVTVGTEKPLEAKVPPKAA
jgi:uncharacterized membrane-anchored protein